MWELSFTVHFKRFFLLSCCENWYFPPRVEEKTDRFLWRKVLLLLSKWPDETTVNFLEKHRNSGLLILSEYVLASSERNVNNMVSNLIVVSIQRRILYQVTTPSKYSDLHYSKRFSMWCSPTARSRM